jgi:hypothetical protein
MSEINPMLFELSPEDIEQEEALFQILSADLSQTKKALDLYAALCNNIWQGQENRFAYSWRGSGEVVANLRNRLELPIEDPLFCQLCGQERDDHYRQKYKSGISSWLEEKGKEPLWLEKFLCEKDGNSFVPGYMGEEEYIDFYCSGNEGFVADWVEEKFRTAGYALAEKR